MHTEEDFPYIRCESGDGTPTCGVSYGAFATNINRVCPHCGRGMMVVLAPESEGYGAVGPESAGDSQMQKEYADHMMRQRRAG